MNAQRMLKLIVIVCEKYRFQVSSNRRIEIKGADDVRNETTIFFFNVISKIQIEKT